MYGKETTYRKLEGYFETKATYFTKINRQNI